MHSAIAGMMIPAKRDNEAICLTDPSVCSSVIHMMDGLSGPSTEDAAVQIIDYN